MFIFIKNYQNIFQNALTILHFISKVREFQFLHVLTNIGCCQFLNYIHSNGCVSTVWIQAFVRT